MKIKFNTNTPSDILDLYWDNKLPIDPEKIVSKIGIKLEKKDLEQEGLSGYFDIDNNGEPVISINTKDSPTRQAFTIAHELGHYFLGHNSSPRKDPQFNLSPATTNIEEQQANDFAAKLLMPSKYVKHFIFNEQIFNVRDLASRFNVSPLAMQFRLKNMGLI